MSYRDLAVKHAMDERDEAREQLRRQQTVDAAAYRAEVDRITAELATCRERDAAIAAQSDQYRDKRDELQALVAEILAELDEWVLLVEDDKLAGWRQRAGLPAVDNRWPCCSHCADGDGMLPCGQVHPEPCGTGSCGEVGDAELSAWRAGLEQP